MFIVVMKLYNFHDTLYLGHKGGYKYDKVFVYNDKSFMYYLQHFSVACERDNRCTACALYLRCCVKNNRSGVRNALGREINRDDFLSQSLARNVYYVISLAHLTLWVVLLHSSSRNFVVVVELF